MKVNAILILINIALCLPLIQFAAQRSQLSPVHANQKSESGIHFPSAVTLAIASAAGSPSFLGMSSRVEQQTGGPDLASIANKYHVQHGLLNAFQEAARGSRQANDYLNDFFRGSLYDREFPGGTSQSFFSPLYDICMYLSETDERCLILEQVLLRRVVERRKKSVLDRLIIIRQPDIPENDKRKALEKILHSMAECQFFFAHLENQT